MSVTIAAYTPPTSPYPPYVNISREADGAVTITVRGPPQPGEFSDHDCGPSATIRLSSAEWGDLFSQILGKGRAVPAHGSGP